MAATLPQPSRPSINPPKAALPPLPPQGLRKSAPTQFDTRLSARLPSTSYGSSRLGLRAPFGSTSSSSALVPQHAHSTSNIPTMRSISGSITRESSPSGKTLRKPISVASFPHPPKGNTRIPSFSARPPSGSVTPTLSAASNRKESWDSDRSLFPSALASVTRLSISKNRPLSPRSHSDTITPTVSSRAGSSESEGAGLIGDVKKAVTHGTFNQSRIPRPSSRPTSQTVTPTSSAPGSRRGSVDVLRPISAGVTGISRAHSTSSGSRIPRPSSRPTSQTVTPSSSAPVSRRASVDLDGPVSSNTSAAVKEPIALRAPKMSRLPSLPSTRNSNAPYFAASRKRGSSDSSGHTENGASTIPKRPSISRSTRVSNITSCSPTKDIKVMLSAVTRQRGSSLSDGSASSGDSVKVKGTSIPRTTRTFRISSGGPSESTNLPSSVPLRKRGSSDSSGSANSGGALRVNRPITTNTKSQTRFGGGNAPSLLNNTGAGNLITRVALEAGLQAGNRFSSAPSTTTQFEDLEDSSADGKSQGANMEKKGNVVVSVRVRPNANGAKVEGDWAVDGRNSVISYRGREGGEFHLDNVFGTTDRNEKIYDACAKRLVRRVMEGYNGTVFAYGMTGTGKTFSMQGTSTSLGVIPLAIADIFSYIRQVAHLEFLLRVSYLEIYNEKIYDLLAPPAATQPGAQNEEIKLREDSTRGVYASPLREEVVQSPTQLLRVIAKGDHARRTSSTQFNARSSRSHAVVQIVVESRERTDGVVDTPEGKDGAPMEGGVRVSTLSLIDLAGSERAAENKERRTEGSHINKSLLTLGTVIARLSGAKESGGKAADKDGKHLPYRDSKLTRLLQPALSGNSLVSILCTVQCGSAGTAVAASGHLGETLNTLKFAARAKNNIVSHAKRVEAAFGNGGDAGTKGLLERYRTEIQNLKTQLERAAGEQTDKEEKKLEKESQQRHEEQMLEMHLARVALKERITHLNRLILSSQSTGVNKGGALSSLSAAVVGVEDSLQSSASEENGSVGGADDGVASLAAQVRALRADLAERDRYIATLEKRLWQARRASHSRTSIGFSPRASSVQGAVESEP